MTYCLKRDSFIVFCALKMGHLVGLLEGVRGEAGHPAQRVAVTCSTVMITKAQLVGHAAEDRTGNWRGLRVKNTKCYILSILSMTSGGILRIKCTFV